MNWPSSVQTDACVNAAEGIVECIPRRKRVALVGFAVSSLHLTPWHDPTYELWGMNQAYQNFERRPDRWFEIHRPENQADVAAPTYADDLRAIGIPVYMIDVDPAVPTSVRYPLERVRAGLPHLYQRYFTSSAAFMVALAIAEGFETIALYGIDCAAGSEYELQKPCLEAWLSLAMGRGVEVIIPPASALFKTPYLYGYEAPRKFPRTFQASEEFLRNRIAGFKATSNEKLRELHQLEGAVAELTELLAFAEAKSRGASYPTVEGST